MENSVLELLEEHFPKVTSSNGEGKAECSATLKPIPLLNG